MGKVDEAYLIENFGAMSQREMAADLGVSVSTVNRHCRRLGLAGLRVGDTAPERPKAHIIAADFAAPPRRCDPAIASGDRARLEDLRDRLLEEIQAAKGASLARLSKEYREVLGELRAMEGTGDALDGSIFADLAANVAGGVPRPDVASG